MSYLNNETMFDSIKVHNEATHHNLAAGLKQSLSLLQIPDGTAPICYSKFDHLTSLRKLIEISITLILTNV